jgi:hypothetical protein
MVASAKTTGSTAAGSKPVDPVSRPVPLRYSRLPCFREPSPQVNLNGRTVCVWWLPESLCRCTDPPTDVWIGTSDGLHSESGRSYFTLWLALDQVGSIHTSNSVQEGLQTISPLSRLAWILARTIGGVVTVPIAEELAFRAFLIRRLISRDFEAVDERRHSYLAVLISSVAVRNASR